MQGGTTQKRPCPFGAGTFFLDHLRMVSNKPEWYRAKAPPMRVFSSEAFFIRNEEWACGKKRRRSCQFARIANLKPFTLDFPSNTIKNDLLLTTKGELKMEMKKMMKQMNKFM